MQQRARQVARQGKLNSELSSAELAHCCVIAPDARQLLAHALDRLGLSARGYHKVLKLALTIADMAGADTILEQHIAEAISYRVLDRRLPGR